MATVKATNLQSGPWWREPWPWFLMAGPAIAIVACAVTITLALEQFSDQPLNNGFKRGLVIERVQPSQAGAGSAAAEQTDAASH